MIGSRWGLAVAIQQPAQAAEDAAFLPAPASHPRSRGDDAVGEARERERLENDPARSRQENEEETLSAKERGFHAGHHLNVVSDAVFHRDETARVNAQRLAGSELHLRQRARRVEEREAVAVEALQDEPFAAEEAGSDAAVERDAHFDPEGRAQERVLLRDDPAIPFP